MDFIIKNFKMSYILLTRNIFVLILMAIHLIAMAATIIIGVIYGDTKDIMTLTNILSYFIPISIYIFIMIHYFNITKNASWNYLFINLSLPVKRKQIVISRYLELLVYAIFMIIYCCIILFIGDIMTNKSLSVDVYKVLIINVIFYATLIGNTVYLIYFGLCNFYMARQLMSVVLVVMILVSYKFKVYLINNILLPNFLLTILISICITLLFMFLSIHEFNKRDIT